MNNVTSQYQQMYKPTQALVIYNHTAQPDNFYVESYDMDTTGRPINAHPLTEKESNILARSFATTSEKNHRFLQPKGILPDNVLYLKQGEEGFCIWHTPAKEQPLFFKDSLNIPNGKAQVPALLWIASRRGLSLFTLASNRRPTLKTQLYNAPFFNVYTDGRVCMGSVKVDFATTESLETFLTGWETYFFNSYFAHTIAGHAPTTVPIVTLWKDQVATGQPFPTSVLVKNKVTLKQLLK